MKRSFHPKGKKVMILKWQDQETVCLLLTVHNPEKARTNKTDRDGNMVMKHKIVVDYNDTMRNADRLDQHLQDNSATRKSEKNIYSLT